MSHRMKRIEWAPVVFVICTALGIGTCLLGLAGGAQTLAWTATVGILAATALVCALKPEEDAAYRQWAAWSAGFVGVLAGAGGVVVWIAS